MASPNLDFLQRHTAAAQKAADNAEAVSSMALLGPLAALVAEIESGSNLYDKDALANPKRQAWIEASTLTANLTEAADQAAAEDALAKQSASASAGLFSSTEAAKPEEAAPTKGFGKK